MRAERLGEAQVPRFSPMLTTLRWYSSINHQKPNREFVKPGAHERKQLSKKSREVVSPVVSSRVRVYFGEEKIIKHVRYLSHDLARQKISPKFYAHKGGNSWANDLARLFCSAVSSRVRRALEQVGNIFDHDPVYMAFIFVIWEGSKQTFLRVPWITIHYYEFISVSLLKHWRWGSSVWAVKPRHCLWQLINIFSILLMTDLKSK